MTDIAPVSEPKSVADFTHNLALVRDRISTAAMRVGRDPAEVRLLPVSKTVPEGRLRLAVEARCRLLGENEVQEAKRKHTNLTDLDVEWAVIGHLQTSKAKDVAALASEFHALDNLRAAGALDRRLQMVSLGLDVYVQVNTSARKSRYGVSPDDVLPFLRKLTPHSSLRVRGLVTLAIFGPRPLPDSHYWPSAT